MWWIQDNIALKSYICPQHRLSTWTQPKMNGWAPERCKVFVQQSTSRMALKNIVKSLHYLYCEDVVTCQWLLKSGGCFAPGSEKESCGALQFSEVAGIIIYSFQTSPSSQAHPL